MNNLRLPTMHEFNWGLNDKFKFPDASQFPLSNQVYNVIEGDDVIINCNFTVQSGQQLEMVAKNFITLEAGFTAETGSVICAEIDPNICGSNLKSAFINNIHDTLYSAENLDGQFKINKIALKSDIQVYPNPNRGSFTVDFGTNDYTIYQLEIRNPEGQIIYSLKHSPSSKVTFNLSNNKSRTYILYLLNTKSKNAIVRNIIIQ